LLLRSALQSIHDGIQVRSSEFALGPLRSHQAGVGAARLGFGRALDSGIEAPIILANLVQRV
jgi:hypothetical protein